MGLEQMGKITLSRTVMHVSPLYANYLWGELWCDTVQIPLSRFHFHLRDPLYLRIHCIKDSRVCSFWIISQFPLSEALFLIHRNEAYWKGTADCINIYAPILWKRCTLEELREKAQITQISTSPTIWIWKFTFIFSCNICLCTCMNYIYDICEYIYTYIYSINQMDTLSRGEDKAPWLGYHVG